MSRIPLPAALKTTGWLLAVAGLAAACGEPPGPEPVPKAAEIAVKEAPPPREKRRVEAAAPIVEVLKETDPFVRASRLATLLPTLDADAARAVPLLLRDATLDLGNVENALLLRFWSLHEPETASDWALFDSPQSRRGASIEIAFAQWAQENPQAAAEDLYSFMVVPGPFTRDAEIALVRGWFASGKPGLTDYIQSIGVGFNRQRAVATYVRDLAARDGVQSALEWAESVEAEGDPAYQKAVLRQTGGVVASLAPLTAAAWCDRICDHPIATNLRAMVAQHWAAQDGRAAMEWLQQAPAGQERDWAVRSAFWGWWRADRDGFEAWIDSAVEGEVQIWLDDAVEVYGAQLAKNQPEKGIAWGARIRDDETRVRTLMNVARIWRMSDEAAAEAWLESSPLDEDQRDRVRNPKPGREVEPVEEDAETSE